MNADPSPARLPRLPERKSAPLGEERRRAILSALDDLLRERALAALTVADVAAASGVGRSNFYFYFANLPAAVSALLGDVFEEMLEGAVDFLRGQVSPEIAIRSAMESTWRSWRDHQGVILAMLDARGADPAVRELWEAWLERFVAPIARVVDDWRLEHRVEDGPDAHHLVVALLGANERTFERLSRSGAAPATVNDALDALVAIWWHAICGVRAP